MHPGAPVHVEFIFKHGWLRHLGKWKQMRINEKYPKFFTVVMQSIGNISIYS